MTYYKIFKAYAKSGFFPSDEKEQKNYIYATARNCFFDKIRFFKRLFNFQKNLEIEEIFSDDYPLKLTLKDLVFNLPQRQKEVFILRHWHGFSTKETAKILKLNEGSVKSHLSRAIEKLKSILVTT